MSKVKTTPSSPRDGFIYNKMGSNVCLDLDARLPKASRLRRGTANVPVNVPAYNKLDLKPLLAVDGETCCKIVERSPDALALLRRGYLELW